MFFTYILQSQQDKSFYIGYSSNLEKRLREHNEGLSKYTKRKIPWKMVYFEVFETKSESIKREVFLKKQKSVVFLKKLIEGFTVD